MAEIDFDEWIKNFKPPEVKFYALFDPADGKVSGIYPSGALEDTKNTVEIDQETASLINEGSLKLSSCFVDMSSGSFKIAEIKSLIKIDDVLHRVIAKEWSDITDPDIAITHDVENKSLIFELSSKYEGTKQSPSASKRKIHWDGSTEMCFLITNYNDPNIIRSMIKFNIEDLVGKSNTFENLPLDGKFSVYTKRLFPLYIIETK